MQSNIKFMFSPSPDKLLTNMSINLYSLPGYMLVTALCSASGGDIKVGEFEVENRIYAWNPAITPQNSTSDLSFGYLVEKNYTELVETPGLFQICENGTLYLRYGWRNYSECTDLFQYYDSEGSRKGCDEFSKPCSERLLSLFDSGYSFNVPIVNWNSGNYSSVADICGKKCKDEGVSFPFGHRCNSSLPPNS